MTPDTAAALLSVAPVAFLVLVLAGCAWLIDTNRQDDRYDVWEDQ